MEGSKKDLEALILRHQSWIYNIAIRMVYDIDDAKDITQEIVIKILTKLSSFDPAKASFRTWLYRIVINHILNLKKSRYKYSFNFNDDYYSLIPDENPDSSPESNLLIKELQISCFLGTLLCFNPRDRLIFILGAVLNVPDTVGSEVMDVSRDNFRKIVSRTKKKLFDYMNESCGLLNPENRCHCSKKINGCVKVGLLNPDKIQFHNADLNTIEEMGNSEIARIGSFWDDKFNEFIHRFQTHPFYDPEDLKDWLYNTIETVDWLLLHPDDPNKCLRNSF